ncbi:MAG: hypothetical protein H5T69_02525 [Chloroflexi bacterium]|nr:hypothetical protein [Chloroflexota bacterium]
MVDEATKQRIIAMAEELAVNGELACADAHRIAAQLGISALEVSRVINRATQLRFFRCQLGLFGYGPKAEGKSKIVRPAERIPEEIDEALSERVRENHISCADLWELADRFKYPRLQMGNIAEAKGLRVRPCQLGCF